jgi:hypothetical protein
VRLIVCMVDAQRVIIENFDADAVLDLLDAVRDGELLTFAAWTWTCSRPVVVRRWSSRSGAVTRCG